MRVLICRSNPIAPDPRVEKTARTLCQAGFEVRVLGWDRTASLSRQEERNGIIIKRLPIRARFGSGLGNLPQLMRWQIGLMAWLIHHRDTYDLIHACDFDTVIPALLMKFLWRKTVIYDIFDFYADHLRKTPDWIKRIIRRVDLWVIGKVDAVILVDDARRAQIAGASPRVLEIIYNSPEDVNLKVIGASHTDHKGLRIAYVGLLQKERGLFELLDVLEKHTDWHLDLAGFGGDEQKILDRIRGMSNVTWHGRVDYQCALALSMAADVLLATYDPSIPNHRYSSPNKVFEAMMLGKPIIVARGTNMDNIITQAGCGLVVDYGSVTALEQALCTLAGDPQLRLRLGQNGRRTYEQKFAWNIMADRLLGLYRRVVSRNGMS
ncbi:glycosyltransferase family 4 protein [Thermanaerothrix sp. 4228-RoL]|uniref:Glycosyltransferase family 4 protein n=1 Tax=Thermanaerothrix solaris TaxID=3058434 RepID=A0ABU3NPF9_9CHLR|nr:glycosyltransferase family 4 protein [Thermanaerothrix sp. 4228-RoL]MDT8897887.1 glycosyltransferase family 4 protein [Thermanaerothrix sp. 4228-RoL]